MTSPDLQDLDASLAEGGRLAAAFAAELGRLSSGLDAASRETGRLERGLSGGLRRAIDGLVFDGDRLGDALRKVGRSVADTVYAAALRPVTDRLGGALAQGIGAALTPFARGGAFTGGRVMPFARGGVVSGPTAFPLRGATGLMGEAGPEAIMPLQRGPDGRLGVRAEGGGRPVRVTIHVSTPDVSGFQRSQGQIAAELARVLARAARHR